MLENARARMLAIEQGLGAWGKVASISLINPYLSSRQSKSGILSVLPHLGAGVKANSFRGGCKNSSHASVEVGMLGVPFSHSSCIQCNVGIIPMGYAEPGDSGDHHDWHLW